MKYVIHFEDNGSFSAKCYDANTDKDATKLFKKSYPYAKIISIKHLVPKPKINVKLVEVKIFHNGG